MIRCKHNSDFVSLVAKGLLHFDPQKVNQPYRHTQNISQRSKNDQRILLVSNFKQSKKSSEAMSGTIIVDPSSPTLPLQKLHTTDCLCVDVCIYVLICVFNPHYSDSIIMNSLTF